LKEDSIQNMNVWLIGVGRMGREYYKALKSLGVSVMAIGRGIENAKCFKQQTGALPEVGGLEAFLSKNPKIVSHAIVAANVESLATVVTQLLNYGVKNILVEKPASISFGEILMLSDLAQRHGANVLVAYNRRFFSSVQMAQELI